MTIMRKTEELGVTPSYCAWLPRELYHRILGFIPAANDLSKLCRVSRTFRDETQPLLYHSFELLYDDSGRILAWCHTIDRCPRLAQMVHFLRLPYELSLSNTSSRRPKFHTLLACALRKTVNLKGISIFELPEISGGVGTDRMCTLIPKIMIGCHFRLLAFSGRLSTNAIQVDWWKFFREQTEIRYWDPVPRIPGHGMSLPGDMFPQLTAIALRQTEPTSNTNLLFHLGSRPIERLSLQWEMSKGNPLYVIGWFDGLTHNITHFNWEALGSTSSRGVTPLTIILALVKQLPKLRFLRFCSGEADSESCDGLMDAISRLDDIDTVMLDILMTTGSDEDSPTCPPTSSDFDFEECHTVAETFMASCSTLRRFSFVAPVSSMDDGRRGIYPCYTKNPGGEIRLAGFDLIHEDSWRYGV